MRLLWAQYSQEKDWGFLLIDMQNAVNEENWTEMLWDVRNDCPSDSQFKFNC